MTTNMTRTPPQTRILIVDDERSYKGFLKGALESQGYLVIEAENRGEVLRHLETASIDIILLDLGLPIIHNFDVIRGVRAQQFTMPILVLSGSAEPAEKIKALDLGADDYIIKPFDPGELLARIRASLRYRPHQKGHAPLPGSRDLALDPDRPVVITRGVEVKLTPREYRILRLFVSHAGKMLTHKAILQHAWDRKRSVQDLRIYIRTLRQKIELDPTRPRHILTEQGVGYRFQLQPAGD